MSVDRIVPDSVWRAQKADDAARRATEDQWDAYLDAKPLPARKPSQWEQVEIENARLEAIVPLGPVDICGSCGERVDAQNGVYECCGQAWDES